MTAVILQNPQRHCRARSLAQNVKSHFSSRPHWGPSVCVEERGIDFSIVGAAPPESNEVGNGPKRVMAA